MKIKVKGKVTPERIAKAMMDVAERYDETGNGYWDAYIYVTFYDNDGLSVDNDKSYTFKAGDDFPDKPEKTGETLAVEASRREWAAKKKAENEELERLLNLRYEAFDIERKIIAHIQKERSKECRFLCANLGNEYAEELNETAKIIWEKVKPTWREKPLELPIFRVEEGSLYLVRSNSGLKKLQSPISGKDIEPIYSQPVWINHLPVAFAAVHERLLSKFPREDMTEDPTIESAYDFLVFRSYLEIDGRHDFPYAFFDIYDKWNDKTLDADLHEKINSRMEKILANKRDIEELIDRAVKPCPSGRGYKAQVN